MNKCRIIVFVGSRSDAGLSAPITKRLRDDDLFTVYELDVHQIPESLLRMADIVVCVGDRKEMFGAATFAFNRDIPIAHVYAGIVVKDNPTKDEVYRHCISLMSELQFCESYDAENNLFHFFNPIGKKSNAHVVGFTHMDDLVIDESKVPITIGGDKAWYNLILYNPLNKDKGDIMKWEIERIKTLAYFGKNRNIVIGSNADPWHIDKRRYKLDEALNFIEKTTFYKNLPRPQFLGLLKNCCKFITNSSSALYEAPHFLKDSQIENIGIRNTKRTPFDINKTGASDKIVKILKEWWIKKNGN